MGLERRKFPRFKDDIFIFGKSISGTTGEFKAITRDISAGGLMFETEEDILKDSKLQLEIYQPIGPGKKMIFSIPVLAEVIWIKRIKKDNLEEGENKNRAGVEFTEIKEEDKQRIIKYINKNTA